MFLLLRVCVACLFPCFLFFLGDVCCFVVCLCLCVFLVCVVVLVLFCLSVCVVVVSAFICFLLYI